MSYGLSYDVRCAGSSSERGARCHQAPRPLIEDDSVTSHSTTLVNARLGYKWENGIRLQLDAFNIFNAQASQIDYYYTSRLPGEPLAGINDAHFHPVEPLAVRFTVAKAF